MESECFDILKKQIKNNNGAMKLEINNFFSELELYLNIRFNKEFHFLYFSKGIKNKKTINEWPVKR